MADLYAKAGATVEVTLTGAPVGLSNVGYRVIDTPSGTVVVARAVATEVTVDASPSGIYTGTLTAPATLGSYTILWDTGSISPTTTSTDSLTVNSLGAAPTIPSVDYNLLTLDEVRTSLGKDPTDTRDDDRINQWIPYVSQVIRSYTERDFGAPTVTEQRSFEYDGSGYLDIDDASAITQVALTFTATPDVVLDSDQWVPKPQRRDDAPLYTYLELWTSGSWGGSPEMGFERNLDVIAGERRLSPYSRLVKVDGTWGWPTIPDDVKIAAFWTLQEWLSRPSGEAVTSEAIEGWSRAWGRNGQAAASLAIPERARDILANYTRIEV